MNRKSPSSMEVKLGPMTRTKRKKLKLQEGNGMLAYMMEATKSKVDEVEDQEKHPKLFTICADDESMEFNCSSQFLLLIESRVYVLDSIDFRSSILFDWVFDMFLELQILNRGTSNQGGHLGRDLDPILQASEDSYQTGIKAFSI
ncbi:hypothetical protein M9H77_13237 [Catharanthus roseus]|uniref:Uncharacterized protein n=1 Tax=Catharanthus roseus TaxID=4058 RepID=A0ACC0BJS8_CATRO|nr:hypothetical protein M9H77_13237 [Catharanthus roseus]